ncbi:MAG: UxaA family hydrolase [Pseudomonadota bacterium]
MTDRSPHQLLLLSNRDNVLVALCPITQGPAQTSDGQRILVQDALTLGHKAARTTIAKGDRILKYGVPIGRATRDIAAGEHVHVHNMASDYTPTHSLKETEGGVDA